MCSSHWFYFTSFCLSEELKSISIRSSDGDVADRTESLLTAAATTVFWRTAGKVFDVNTGGDKRVFVVAALARSSFAN